MPAEVETMFSVREAPWYGLGTVVQEAPTSEEALKLAGLDWEVIQQPVVVEGRVVPGYKANVRSTDGAVLGIVSSDYTVVQNRDAFKFTDALVSDGVVRYETAGSLRGGKVVWLQACLIGGLLIDGDVIEPYLLFTNGHDGAHAVRVCITPIRVVCMNTLNLALTKASRTRSVIHLGDAKGRLHEAQRTLDLAWQYLRELEGTARDLLNVEVSESRWEQLVGELLPIPEDTGTIQRRHIESLREDLAARIRAPDLERFAGTAWAAVNAVAAHVVHVPPLRQVTGWRESRFARIAFGHPLLDRAVKLLLEGK